MVRTSEYLEGESAIWILIRYAHHYRHGRYKRNDQIYFFSKYKSVCDRMLIFGGNVYRQYGGYCWVAGKTKQLIALARLMESEDIPPERTEIRTFVKRMRRKSLEWKLKGRST